MVKWTVGFSPSAEKQLEIIYKLHKDLRPDILARLRILEDFPPEKWFFIFKHNGLNYFRAEMGQMVRITGEAHYATRSVQITNVVVARKPPSA